VTRGSDAAVEYAECWFAYLDILGFREMVTGATDEEASELIASLKVAMDTVGGTTLDLALTGDHDPSETVERRYKAPVRIFSDTMCMWMPVDGDELEAVAFLMALSRLVCGLALHGIFLRGAIGRDRHYDDGNLTFSRALVSAYDVESKEAFYPRVIADPTVSAAFGRARAHLSGETGERLGGLLWADHDGRSFLNYLQSLWLPGDIHPCPVQALAEHRLHIARNLSNHAANTRVAAKYVWLAQYHNRCCRQAIVDEDERSALEVPLNPG